MANFFQSSGDPETTDVTPSPANQAFAKFRAQMLMQLLQAAQGNRPTFKSFTEGGPATTPFPGNALAGGLPSVMQAMDKPGAFTTTKQVSGGGETPSMLSDIVSLAVVASLLGGGKTDLLSMAGTGASGLWNLLGKGGSALGSGASGLWNLIRGGQANVGTTAPVSDPTTDQLLQTILTSSGGNMSIDPNSLSYTADPNGWSFMSDPNVVPSE